MIKGLTMVALLLFFAAGCAGGSGGDAGSSTGNTSDSPGTTESAGTNATTGGTSEVPETTRAAEGGTTELSQTGVVRVEQLSSGTMGPERRQILISTSAQDLAAATGLEIPDAGEGAYVMVAWGEKPTGGYTVDFGSADVEGVRVTVNVTLEDPPPDAMVAQALTYPYAVAFLPDVDAGEQEFVFVTQNGREIGWPVRSV